MTKTQYGRCSQHINSPMNKNGQCRDSKRNGSMYPCSLIPGSIAPPPAVPRALKVERFSDVLARLQKQGAVRVVALPPNFGKK